MNATKKPTFYTKWIKPNITSSLLIFIIGGGIAYYINNEIKDADVEQRIYPTPERLIRAMDHDDEVPSDVENFKREQRLIVQGDSNLILQKDIKSQQKEIIEIKVAIDSFYGLLAEKARKDSIKDRTVNQSRAKRDVQNYEILEILKEMKAEKDTTQ